MKKWFVLLLAGLMALGLAACGGSAGGEAEGLADGEYTAQADDAWVEGDGYGWRDTLSITVEGGKITAASYDAFDAEGKAKSQPGNYEGMEPPPSDWMPQLSANVESAGLDGTVDAVAGATTSSENVQKLLDAIKAEGSPGATIDVAL